MLTLALLFAVRAALSQNRRMTAMLAARIAALISDGGYLAIAMLMALESACLPIPSELIMPFAGFLVSTGRFGLLPAVLAGALGCNLGSAAAYAIGARGGRAFVVRYGRFVLATPADLDSAQRFFARFGSLAVLIGRLLPVVRTFIALPAGIGRMKLLPFHLYTFAGSFIWCLALAGVGERLGRAWNSSPTLREVLHRLDLLLVAAILVGAGWFVWRRLGARGR